MGGKQEPHDAQPRLGTHGREHVGIASDLFKVRFLRARPHGTEAIVNQPPAPPCEHSPKAENPRAHFEKRLAKRRRLQADQVLRRSSGNR
jgi:hypothetical protein